VVSAAVEPSSKPNSISNLRIAGIASSTAGVAGMVAGAVCWGLGKSRHDDAMNNVNQNYGKAQSLQSDAQDYVTAGTPCSSQAAPWPRWARSCTSSARRMPTRHIRHARVPDTGCRSWLCRRQCGRYMVMLRVRSLAIVLLATMAVACTIGGLPQQPNQDAAAGVGGAGGRNIGANADAANINPGIEAGTSTGGAGTTGIGNTLSGTGGSGGTKGLGGMTGVGRTATGGSSGGATSAGGTSGDMGGATIIPSGGKTNPTGGTITSSGGVST